MKGTSWHFFSFFDPKISFSCQIHYTFCNTISSYINHKCMNLWCGNTWQAMSYVYLSLSCTYLPFHAFQGGALEKNVFWECGVRAHYILFAMYEVHCRKRVAKDKWPLRKAEIIIYICCIKLNQISPSLIWNQFIMVQFIHAIKDDLARQLQSIPSWN